MRVSLPFFVAECNGRQSVYLRHTHKLRERDRLVDGMCAGGRGSVGDRGDACRGELVPIVHKRLGAQRQCLAGHSLLRGLEGGYEWRLLVQCKGVAAHI